MEPPLITEFKITKFYFHSLQQISNTSSYKEEGRKAPRVPTKNYRRENYECSSGYAETYRKNMHQPTELVLGLKQA